MFRKIGPQVGVAVITAVILGALALVGNFATSGGLVKALGGVPTAELEAMIGHPHEAPPEPIASMPKDAVVAFDDNSCPAGWSPFSEVHSRMIVGADDGSSAGLYSVDPDGNSLRGYKYRDKGGWQMVELNEDQMPSHFHALKRIYAFNSAWGPGAVTLTGQDGPVEEGDLSKWTFSSDRDTPQRNELKATEATGGGQPHNNMPPFIALYFCKKD